MSSSSPCVQRALEPQGLRSPLGAALLSTGSAALVPALPRDLYPSAGAQRAAGLVGVPCSAEMPFRAVLCPCESSEAPACRLGAGAPLDTTGSLRGPREEQVLSVPPEIWAMGCRGALSALLGCPADSWVPSRCPCTQQMVLVLGKTCRMWDPDLLPRRPGCRTVCWGSSRKHVSPGARSSSSAGLGSCSWGPVWLQGLFVPRHWEHLPARGCLAWNRVLTLPEHACLEGQKLALTGRRRSSVLGMRSSASHESWSGVWVQEHHVWGRSAAFGAGTPYSTIPAPLALGPSRRSTLSGSGAFRRGEEQWECPKRSSERCRI